MLVLAEGLLKRGNGGSIDENQRKGEIIVEIRLSHFTPFARGTRFP
jgi:hypothetical protein